MEEVSVIGIDLAKRSFQVHGAKSDGSVAYRRKLGRGKLLSFLASQPRCTVAMEACGSAHYWGREIEALGHQVRLLPPIYVKPFVKRHENALWPGVALSRLFERGDRLGGDRCVVFVAGLLVLGAPADGPVLEVDIGPAELADGPDTVAGLVRKHERDAESPADWRCESIRPGRTTRPSRSVERVSGPARARTSSSLSTRMISEPFEP